MSELKRAIEEYKNCPCCDSENIEVGSVVVSFGEDIFIKCNSCNLKMQLCKEHGWEELLKRWNTRIPMQNIVERLEEKYEESTSNYHDLKDASCLGERHAYRKAIEIVKEEGGIR